MTSNITRPASGSGRMFSRAVSKVGSRWLAWGCVVLACVALAALVIVIEAEPPDGFVVGSITGLEAHELCVGRPVSSPICAEVDYPGTLNGLAIGDCVTMKYSGEGILESVRRADQCDESS
jgi:hypothetical protein